jgi:hypothetical protein
MPQGTVKFFTTDGKMRLTLSGTYSKVLEEIDGGGAFALTEFSGVVFVDCDREVAVSGDDNLVPAPEPGTLFKEMEPDRPDIDPKNSPTTPTKKAQKYRPLASIRLADGRKTPEDKKKLFATPLRNEEPDEVEENKKSKWQASDEEHHGDIVDVDDDGSVDLDYDYSQQVNWVDEETMRFMLDNSSPQVESRFNVGFPDTDKVWSSGKKSNNKNKKY